MRITPEVKILIERKEGNLGFSLQHKGTWDAKSESYEGSYGDMSGLREALLKLLDELEENDQKTFAAMEEFLKNADLPQAAKETVAFNLKCWGEGLERNRKAKERQTATE